MQTATVTIKKLDPRATIPTYGSEQAAGADLYAVTDGDVTIAPGETVLIHTGLSMELPVGYVGLIYARSGLASKKGLAPANKVGVIDSDYRGELMVLLINLSQNPFTVNDGERIAQLVIARHEQAVLTAVEVLDKTERGTGGYGHTGVK